MAKCRICKTTFEPRNSLQIVCSPQCAYEHVKNKNEMKAKKEKKVARKANRAAREALKTRSDYVKEAQVEFNKFIRTRDAHLPCISCGAFSEERGRGGSWDCGHYRSTGANPELRFNTFNAHKQCKKCNRNLSGNIVNYRIGLLEKIGKDKLDWVEGPHEIKHYSKEDLKRIKRIFAKRARFYIRRRNA